VSGRLVHTFTGDGRTTGAMRDTFIATELGPGRAPSGLRLDGAVYGLDGQPPAARGGQWGFMGWIYSAFYQTPRLRG
jgi:hypothetical protein